MSDQTSADMRPATLAKSDQINADDLIGSPITITVQRAVRYDRKEQPVEIHTVETPGRCYRPCKTMVRALVAAWGHDGDAWAGRRMTLARDPRVRFGADEVGGIRVSHVSGLHGPMRLSLAVSKGKKGAVTIEPLSEHEPLAAAMERHGLGADMLDSWLAAKGRAPIAEMAADGRARMAAWLDKGAPLDEIRAAVREPGQEG